MCCCQWGCKELDATELKCILYIKNPYKMYKKSNGSIIRLSYLVICFVLTFGNQMLKRKSIRVVNFRKVYNLKNLLKLKTNICGGDR